MSTPLQESSSTHRGVAGQSAWARYLELLDRWAADAKGSPPKEPAAPVEPSPPKLPRPQANDLRGYLLRGGGAACAVTVPVMLLLACAVSDGSPYSSFGALVFALVLGLPLGLAVGLPWGYRRYRREEKARLQWEWWREQQRMYEGSVERHPEQVAAWREAHARWVARGHQLEQVRQAAVHDFEGGQIRQSVPPYVTNWARGAVGERATEQQLRRLPAGHHAWHDVAVRGSRANVDHVLVGPAGLVVLDSKRWSGTVRLDAARRVMTYNGDPKGAGDDRDPLDLVAWEATEVAKLVGPLPATAVAVFVLHGSRLPDGAVQRVPWPTLLPTFLVAADALLEFLADLPGLLARPTWHDGEVAAVAHACDATLVGALEAEAARRQAAAEAEGQRRGERRHGELVAGQRRSQAESRAARDAAERATQAGQDAARAAEWAALEAAEAADSADDPAWRHR